MVQITDRPAIFDFPDLGSVVSCTTEIIPGKKEKRQGYAHTICTTSYYTIRPASASPAPTSTPLRLTLEQPLTLFPIFLPSSSTTPFPRITDVVSTTPPITSSPPTPVPNPGPSAEPLRSLHQQHPHLPLWRRWRLRL